VNYITNTTDPQTISITTRANLSNGDTAAVTVELIPENREDVLITSNGVLTQRGYYTSLTFNQASEALNLSPETEYVLKVKDTDDNIIYRGKALSTEQTISSYSVYNAEFTQTTSDPNNDFIILE
jgi:hypothetical protein